MSKAHTDIMNRQKKKQIANEAASGNKAEY
jgi:hypothetical protein